MIDIVDDNEYEENELFRIHICEGTVCTTSAGGHGYTDIIITDDDPEESFPVDYQVIGASTVQEGGKFRIRISTSAVTKRDNKVRFYVYDPPGSVYFDKVTLHGSAVPLDRPISTVTLPNSRARTGYIDIDIHTIRSDLVSRGGRYGDRIQILPQPSEPGGQPYFNRTGEVYLHVTEVESTLPYVTIKASPSVQEGGELSLGIDTWTKTTNAAKCLESWGDTGSYRNNPYHPGCYVSGNPEPITVNIEVSGETSVDHRIERDEISRDGGIIVKEESKVYEVTIPSTPYRRFLFSNDSPHTLKIPIGNDIYRNIEDGIMHIDVLPGTGYSSVSDHPSRSSTATVRIKDDEALTQGNRYTLTLRAGNFANDVFQDQTEVTEGESIKICGFLDRPYEGGTGFHAHLDNVLFLLTPFEDLPILTELVSFHNDSEPRFQQLITVRFHEGDTKSCSTLTFLQNTAYNVDIPFSIGFFLNRDGSENINDRVILEKYRPTFVLKDDDPLPRFEIFHESIVNDNGIPASISENGGTVDFTVKLTEPLDAWEKFQLKLRADAHNEFSGRKAQIGTDFTWELVESKSSSGVTPNVAINVVCHAAFSRYFKDLMVGIAVLFNLTCGESERQSKIDTRSCEIGDLPTIG